MVFAREEDIQGQLACVGVWGGLGGQGQFITTWLSFWLKILALFDISTRLLSKQGTGLDFFSVTGRHYLIWYLVYQNQNRPFQRGAKSFMIKHKNVRTLVDCFKLKYEVESNTFFKTPCKRSTADMVLLQLLYKTHYALHIMFKFGVCWW